jgi:hypothetical protein
MNEEKNEVAVFNGIEMRVNSLDDIWLTQKQIAQMFDTSKQNVGHHINAFLKELDDEQVSLVVKKSFTTTQHGAIQGKIQTNEVTLYGFEVICQIGYRVNCKRGFQFRQFATKAVMEKLNRDLLNRDDETNRMHIENQNLKVKIGEAVMEISELEQQLEWQSQFVPDDADYGKIASNGFPRLTIQKGGYKSRGGKKVALKPQYVTIDLVAMAHYMLDK